MPSWSRRSSGYRRSTSRSSPPTRAASAPATATTRARPTASPQAIASATEKIRTKAQLLAGMALEAPADELRWEDGVFVGTAGARTIADVALYAHGSGALPPGVEGGLDAQAVYR